jgi:hypothetical protein
MKNSKTLLRLVALFLLVALSCLTFPKAIAAQAGPDDPKEGCDTFEKRKEYYDKSKGHNSLRWKCRGIVTLAAGGDAAALDILFARYRAPEAPQDHIRFIIANCLHDYYNLPQHADKLMSFAEAQTTKEHAWLWYQLYTVFGEHKGFQKLVDIAKAEKADAYKRATAMFAMKNAKADVQLPFINEMLDKDLVPKNPIGRSLVLEGLAFSLCESGADRASKAYEDVFNKLGALFDDKKTPERTKFVMGRYFAKMYGIKDVWINFDAWRRVHMGALAGVNDGKEGGRTHEARPPRPEFVGIKANGKRVAFIIDLSDSMLEPVKKPPTPPKAPPEKEKDITGGGKGKKDKDKKDEEKKKPTQEERLPWDKIKNRWDLAREYLKLSLKDLDKDMMFTIAIFGTKAEKLGSTKAMIQVSDASISAAISDLDGMKIGGPTPIKAMGTLKGDTNIHGGFRRAFETSTKGLSSRDEYVDDQNFLDGADIMFLLSDGAPVNDDFDTTDAYEEGITVVKDREAGTAAAPTATILYQGPYSQPKWLVRDIQRMNMFHHAEIHTIGIGEANEGLMRQIARENFGEVIFMGGINGDRPPPNGGKKGK